MNKPVCLILGAGAGIGGNVAKRFSREGYHACLARRSDKAGLDELVTETEAEGGSASGFMLNAVEEGSIERMVTHVEASLGPIAVAVFNLGAQIGGAVDAPDTLGKMLGPERFQALREKKGLENDGLLVPAEVASTYFHVAHQHRSAWTFELDLRAHSDLAWWNHAGNPDLE